MSFVEGGANLGNDLRAGREWVRQMKDDGMIMRHIGACLGVSERMVGRYLGD